MLFWFFFLLANMFQDRLEDEDDRNNIFIAGFQERKQVDVTAAGLEGNKMATDLHPCQDKDRRSQEKRITSYACVVLSL